MEYENVVLVVHLLLALTLIGVVLMQRSEGGGLGIGGGGGATGSRPATTGISKITWALSIAFIATSITLTIIAAGQSAGSSVVDSLDDLPAAEGAATPDLGDNLLPPSLDGDPLLPSGN